MKFGPVAIDDAVGVILAHTLRAGDSVFRKGLVLTADDAAALKIAGVLEVTAAKLSPSDVPEDQAAAEIARLVAGDGLRTTAARTGRCNLEAAAAGLIQVDAARIDAVNRLSEAVTVATLPPLDAVTKGQVAATVKIIPFAVPAAIMAAVRGALAAPALTLAPFRPLRTVVISTLAPGLKGSVVSATEDVTEQRIMALGGSVLAMERVPHDVTAVAQMMRAALAAGAEQILIIGASATADRDDVAPAAIVAAGGAIDHFGMPVDPGNLLVLAHVGAVPVLVLPGCARSPRLNGADWVMRRIACGLGVTAADIGAMGVGGLLVDTPVRPLPRDRAVKSGARNAVKKTTPEKIMTAAVEPATPPPIAAVVLAAGQSRRMGPHNKLVMPLGGRPLIRRTLETVLAVEPAQVIVVTGHEPAMVAATVAGLPLTVHHNPDYAEGLSTSLRVGLAAVRDDMAGAMICLGDMPSLTAAHLQRLMAGFDPERGRAIGVPVHNGRRGNPVLWARQFFDDMREIEGDVGARHLIGRNESLVYEVEFGDTAVLIDLDTPEQWSEYVSKSSV